MNPTAKTLALSITFSAALAACGGGGGTTPTTTPTAPTTPAPIATNPIVTSVPVSTYAAGSDERIAYDYLNAERQKCGFGLLAQDTRLDASAAAHVSYLLKNNVIAHYETAVQLMDSISTGLEAGHVGLRGFVGEYLQDRGLPQIMPVNANMKRVEMRTALGFLREDLMRVMSSDAGRVSNIDREETGKLFISYNRF